MKQIDKKAKSIVTEVNSIKRTIHSTRGEIEQAANKLRSIKKERDNRPKNPSSKIGFDR